jgi:hypothetical protein
VDLERPLDGLDGSVDSGAVAPRGGEQDPPRPGNCSAWHDFRVPIA